MRSCSLKISHGFNISKLFLEYYDLGSFDGLLSHHSEEQRNLYLEHPISQYIGRHDDDNKLEDRHKPSGTNNTYTFDIIKSYSSVLLHRKDYWLVPSAYDVFEEFDMNNSEHINIPYGEYILHSGSYGRLRNKMKWNVNYYSFSMIRELLKQEEIKFNDIKYIRKIKKVLPPDYFTKFVKSSNDIFGSKISKKMINTFIGGLHLLTFKR